MTKPELEIGLIGGTEKREIKIVDYDHRWRLKFLEHEKKISSALPIGSKFKIEHLGSTSVPELAAKPIGDYKRELLGEKYKNNDPSSEEEFWIPIKAKVAPHG
jgi:GrpB-like predicted nucleotidyltransferase (UPF0157 family)